MKPTPRTVCSTRGSPVGLELAAQVADEDVGDVRPGIERVAPHLLVQARAIEHLAGVAQEEVQQVELAARQAEVAPAAQGVVRARVERDVADASAPASGVAGRRRSSACRRAVTSSSANGLTT